MRLKTSWWLVFALWTIPPLLATTSFLLRFRGEEVPLAWWRFFLNQLVLWYPWALLTPLVFHLGRRFPLARPHAGLHLLLHAVVSAVLGIAFFSLVLGAEVAKGLELGAVPERVLVQSLVNTAPFHAAIYWILIGVSRALAYHQRNRERESLLTQARLQALKAQVHPHFLFNTLHAISTLMEDDVKAARRMIARLSELLRVSLSSSGSDEVTLAEELDVVKLYLDIEEVRFEDRLRVAYRVEPEVCDALVPHLVLQPLVENAIRHGVSRCSGAGLVELSARRDNGCLRLAVSDDGPGLGAEDPSEGIGLANTRSRLEQMYGHTARLDLREREPRGCEAILEVPIRWNRREP